MYKNSIITGTGAYIPDLRVKNSFFEQIMETSDEWIRTRTGVSERRIEQDKGVHEMMACAAYKAMESAGIEAADIDIIIAYSCTSDYAYPSAGCLTQNIIGAVNAFAFDVNAACASFVTQLDIADLYIQSGRAKNILILTGDIMSRHVDFHDRATAILFGDGAGAVIVSLEESTEKRGVLASWIFSESDGNKATAVYCRNYVPEKIINPETMTYIKNSERLKSYITQNGREVFQFAVNALPKSIEKVLAKTGISLDDVKYVIAHQANARILGYVAEKYGLTDEKMPIRSEKYANMSTSTITVLLNDMFRGGKIQKGDIVLFSGFGSGLVYGANIVRF